MNEFGRKKRKESYLTSKKKLKNSFSDLVSWNKSGHGLELVEERVVLPLLLRLHQEVDAGGRGPAGGSSHLTLR